MKSRRSGILLHISSLPSDFGIGDLGPWAYRFADFLKSINQSLWQILPLGPTSPAIGNSPYSSCSAFAGNPILISPEQLVREGLLSPGDLHDAPTGDDPSLADYPAAEAFKFRLLRRAYERARQGLGQDHGFLRFCDRNAHWLDDFALFVTIKSAHGGAVWNTWPAPLRDRDPSALEAWTAEKADELRYEKFVQYLFARQWDALHAYCSERRIHIVGDLPIYVTFDSADVWVHHRLFKMDEHKQPIFIAGVPPDYFSETGQLWGNPVYDWDAMGQDGYAWWVRRAEHNFHLFDLVRLDHFRGFAGYWEVPAHEETAINGRWVDAPGADFFTALSRCFPSMPIIAEDLGVITADVRELKQRFGFPGMKILQFGFGGGPLNPDAMHNHIRDCVVYTGTHDNNTVRGWYSGEATPEELDSFRKTIGKHPDETEVHLDFMRLAMMSPGRTAILPMQDALGLDASARMNTPSVAQGNWEWRVTPDQMKADRHGALAEMTAFFGRL